MRVGLTNDQIDEIEFVSQQLYFFNGYGFNPKDALRGYARKVLAHAANMDSQNDILEKAALNCLDEATVYYKAGLHAEHDAALRCAASIRAMKRIQNKEVLNGQVAKYG